VKRLLAHRDARLFLAGQSLSLLGDTALWLALGLWVKELTGSSSAAGLVFLCIVAPGLLSPLGGLLVDRLPRRSVLLVVNPLTALIVLPLLFVRDAGDVWLIYVVATLYGTSYVVLAAGQSALLTELLPEDLLGPANAASQTVREEDVRGQFALGPDAEPYVEAVRKYADAGFDHLVLQNAGPDPDGFIDFFHKELHDKLQRL